MDAIVALPAEHAASSRLAWRIAHAVASRDKRWTFQSTHVSRRWQFRVGRARWIAEAYISFFFHDGPHGPGTVFAIHFKGRGSVRARRESVRSLAA